MRSIVRFLRRHAGILWALALMLLACGQYTLAFQDLECAEMHSHEQHSAAADSEDCPASHSCCHPHSHNLPALGISSERLIVSVFSSPVFDRNIAAVEGPSRDIDLPPQLA